MVKSRGMGYLLGMWWLIFPFPSNGLILQQSDGAGEVDPTTNGEGAVP
jgi:hypothetical protein